MNCGPFFPIPGIAPRAWFMPARPPAGLSATSLPAFTPAGCKCANWPCASTTGGAGRAFGTGSFQIRRGVKNSHASTGVEENNLQTPTGFSVDRGFNRK